MTVITKKWIYLCIGMLVAGIYVCIAYAEAGLFKSEESILVEGDYSFQGALDIKQFGEISLKGDVGIWEDELNVSFAVIPKEGRSSEIFKGQTSLMDVDLQLKHSQFNISCSNQYINNALQNLMNERIDLGNFSWEDTREELKGKIMDMADIQFKGVRKIQNGFGVEYLIEMKDSEEVPYLKFFYVVVSKSKVKSVNMFIEGTAFSGKFQLEEKVFKK